MDAHQRRLAFDEFFHLQVALAQRRAALSQEAAIPVASSPTPMALAREILPFELTGAQARALGEVAADLSQPIPMARANVSPCRHTFSTAITAASPTIAPTFITPNATMRSISAQQQPRQNHPWLAPARRSRLLPR